MLRPEAVGEILTQTVRVAKAAFPKGSTVIKLRDAFGTLYQDKDFVPFFSNLGYFCVTCPRTARTST